MRLWRRSSLPSAQRDGGIAAPPTRRGALVVRAGKTSPAEDRSSERPAIAGDGLIDRTTRRGVLGGAGASRALASSRPDPVLRTARRTVSPHERHQRHLVRRRRGIGVSGQAPRAPGSRGSSERSRDGAPAARAHRPSACSPHASPSAAMQHSHRRVRPAQPQREQVRCIAFRVRERRLLWARPSLAQADCVKAALREPNARRRHAQSSRTARCAQEGRHAPRMICPTPPRVTCGRVCAQGPGAESAGARRAGAAGAAAGRRGRRGHRGAPRQGGAGALHAAPGEVPGQPPDSSRCVRF